MEDLSNENIIHVCKNDIEYIQFKKLLEYPEIEHCYTMRHSDINFRVYEDNKILQKSYDKICNALNFNRDRIVRPHQAHTDKIEIVSEVGQTFNGIDGMITDKKDIVLCTTSADCTSLLFYDPVKKVIGAVHSGWRGTLQKIGQKAVNKMIETYKCNPTDIICCICPHIRKCHFEVDEDVMQLFKNEFVDNFSNEKEKYKIDKNSIEETKNYKKETSKKDMIDQIITLGENKNGVQKYYIDTTLINKIMLAEIGVQEKNIIDSNICTVCKSEHFHSYRADKEMSGRNVGLISKK